MYILSLKDGRHYCGITNNVDRRLNEHKNKRKSWASKIGVIKIEYVVRFDDRKQAAKTERKVKIFGVTKFLRYFRVHHKSKF